MTRAQRIFIALGLPILALALHFSLCDWHYKANVRWRSGEIQMHSSLWTRQERDPMTRDVITTGLITSRLVDRGTAVVWGVIMPVTLIAGEICWMLGWRRQRRLAAGCCGACGYDLRGSTARTCPECGKPVIKQKAEMT